MEKRTEWLGNLSTQNFKAVICEQCEFPMIVGPHLEKLESNEQYAEAGSVATAVGESFFGKGQWSIDTKQRSIPQHFHWHVRPLN